MSEIIISLTTTSERINNVYLVIQSLLQQNTSYIYTIRLYISTEPHLIDNGIDSIPDNLNNLEIKYENFNIYTTSNLGPYRKLLPILNEKFNEDCLIITVDDDKLYKPNLVEKLVNGYFNNKGKFIIANRAFLKVNNILLDYIGKKNPIVNHVENFLKEPRDSKLAQNIVFRLGKKFDVVNKLAFLEGNDGVLYHPKFFHPIVLDWESIKKIGKSHDDYWFKLCALLNGTGVISLNRFHHRVSKQISNTHQTGLHQNYNKGQYKKSLYRMCKFLLTNKEDILPDMNKINNIGNSIYEIMSFKTKDYQHLNILIKNDPGAQVTLINPELFNYGIKNGFIYNIRNIKSQSLKGVSGTTQIKLTGTMNLYIGDSSQPVMIQVIPIDSMKDRKFQLLLGTDNSEGLGMLLNLGEGFTIWNVNVKGKGRTKVKSQHVSLELANQYSNIWNN